MSCKLDSAQLRTIIQNGRFDCMSQRPYDFSAITCQKATVQGDTRHDEGLTIQGSKVK